MKKTEKTIERKIEDSFVWINEEGTPKEEVLKTLMLMGMFIVLFIALSFVGGAWCLNF